MLDSVRHFVSLQEIKQEDVVDLGEEEEEGDWGGGGLGDIVGDEGGTGNDSLSSADNTVNFSEVMLPHADGSGAVGDSAMVSVDTFTFFVY